MILPVEVAVVLLWGHSRPAILDEVAAEEHPQRAAVPGRSGPLRRVRAVVDRAAVSSQPHVEQLPARVVMAAVIERRRGPELLADQLPLRVVLDAG